MTSILCLILTLVACSPSRNHQPNVVIKANNGQSIDSKGTRAAYTTLDNGLRVLVMSNPIYKESMVSAYVGAGSAQDPTEHLGLAHFVEHMLFLGNKKYPKPRDSYLNYVNSKKGEANALTGKDRTIYYIKIKNEYFDKSVDLISASLEEPLFNNTYIQKAKNEIDEEYYMRFDDRGVNAAYNYVQPEHSPLAKFSVGSKETLKDTMPADAKKFFDKYYVAKNMNLVLVSNKSIEELISLAKIKFSALRSGERFEQPAPVEIEKERMNKMVLFQGPTVENRIIFSLNFKSKLEKLPREVKAVLISIVGDEGRGSLTSALETEGLIKTEYSSLSANIDDDNLSVSVKPTEKGLEDYSRIARIIKKYVMGFVKTKKIQDYHIEQSYKRAKIDQLYTDYTSYTAGDVRGFNSFIHASENWLNLFEEGQPISFQAVRKGLDDVTSSMELTDSYIFIQQQGAKLLSDSFVANYNYENSLARRAEHEKDGKNYFINGFYNVSAEVIDFSIASLEVDADFSEFAYAPQNFYYPENFIFYNQGKNDEELKSIDNENVSILFQPIDYPQPVNEIDLYVSSKSIPKLTAQEGLSLAIFSEYFNSESGESIYPMQEAFNKLSLTFSYPTQAFTLSLHTMAGASNKIFKDYISLIQVTENETLFQQIKKSMIGNILRNMSGGASAKLREEQKKIYVTNYIPQEEQLQILGELTYNDMRTTAAMFFSDVYVRGVVSGHYEANFMSHIEEVLHNQWPPSLHHDSYVYDYPSYYKDLSQINGADRIVEVEGLDESILNYSYVFNRSSGLENKIISEVLSQWMGPSFFDELRTKKQLAYSLGIYPRNFWDQQFSLNSYVLSANHGPLTLKAEVESFMKTWVVETLAKKSQADLDKTVADLREENESMNSQTYKHKQLVDKHLYNFDRKGVDGSNLTIDQVREQAFKSLVEDPQGLFLIITPKGPSLPPIMQQAGMGPF